MHQLDHRGDVRKRGVTKLQLDRQHDGSISPISRLKPFGSRPLRGARPIADLGRVVVARFHHWQRRISKMKRNAHHRAHQSAIFA
jgi:hypothetical protein